jgi:hypothetical protein
MARAEVQEPKTGRKVCTPVQIVFVVYRKRIAPCDEVF